jgi:opacity protein-like surface antigen
MQLFILKGDFMKKLLLAAATSAAILSSTAFAAEENTFYLKANAGANKMNQVKENKTKLKSKFTPVLDLGVGYYIMDNVRTDLTLGFVFNPEQKKTYTNNYGGKTTGKSKANITTLMLNGYVDMFDISIAKIFAGAGVGLSRVKEKQSESYSTGGSWSASSKTKTNVAYQLTLGASAEVAPGVNAELAYKWMDYGKSKFKKDKNGYTPKGNSFKGHHVVAGIRFDL